MKKPLIFIVCISIMIPLIGSLYCNEYYDAELRAMGLDPARVTYFDLNGNQVSQDQFLDDLTRIALEGESPEVKAARAAGTLNNSGKSAAAQSATAAPAASSGNSKKQSAPKEKVTVWFTDARGRVIGSTQVTKGTTVAESQFMTDVPDFEDGRTFDKWDYDGRVIEHEYIIRANYK